MMTQTSWLDVTCPICQAVPAKACTSPSGAALPHPHAARVEAAERATTAPAVVEPTSPRPPLYGYTGTGETPHLVTADGSLRSVCGRNLTWIPNVQPTNPAVCKSCTRLLDTFGVAYQPPPPEGICPVCWAEERLVAGRLAPHKQLVVGVAGVRRSDVACAGAGELPEVAS